MAEHHEPGTMNIEQNERTFHDFVMFSRNMVYFIIFILIVLAVFGA